MAPGVLVHDNEIDPTVVRAHGSDRVGKCVDRAVSASVDPLPEAPLDQSREAVELSRAGGTIAVYEGIFEPRDNVQLEVSQVEFDLRYLTGKRILSQLTDVEASHDFAQQYLLRGSAVGHRFRKLVCSGRNGRDGRPDGVMIIKIRYDPGCAGIVPPNFERLTVDWPPSEVVSQLLREPVWITRTVVGTVSVRMRIKCRIGYQCCIGSRCHHRLIPRLATIQFIGEYHKSREFATAMHWGECQL